MPAGRPKLPKSQAKGKTLSIRFSPEERLALNRAAKRKKQRVSDWGRNILLREAGHVSEKV